MPVVLDASMVLAWTFKDERDAYARAGAQTVLSDGALVPTIWYWEVQNALLTAERARRITSQDLSNIQQHLMSLPIEMDPIGPAITFGTEIDAARRMSLSIYDAAYLDLALRRGLKLMTCDKRLGNAADLLKIRWVDT